MFNRILVATDGSDKAVAAVRQTAGLAKLAASAEVLVVHVCPGCTADVDIDDTNRKIAERLVQEAGDMITGEGVEVRLIVEADYPPESTGLAISDIARDEKADLIVIGSRGLSEVKGFFLGSVSKKVLQHAECPVLVVRG